MDQAAKPILVAAIAIMAFSLVILGIRAGDDEDAAPNGDGATASGQTDDDIVAAPDTSDEPTPAADPTPEDTAEPAPDASTEPDTAPDASDEPDTAPDDEGDTDGSTDAGDDGDTDAAPGDDELDGLDDMPQTGGGALAALGGLVAAGAAGGLARRQR